MDTPSPSSSSSSPPPSQQPLVSVDNVNAITAVAAKPVGNDKKKAKKRLFKDAASASTSSGFSLRGTARVACKRRSPKVVVNAARRNPNSDEIGFRLGMSMAVFFNQVRIGSV